MDEHQAEPESFPSTCWSEVAAAASLETPEGRAALGRLLQRYQPALVAYTCKKFCPGNQDFARELFQRFVADIVITKSLIGQVRPIKGHQFRSFLLSVLHNFMISELRREYAQKRHPVAGLDSLDERAEQGHVPPGETHPANFDIEWARGVVLRAMEEMERDCTAEQIPHVWKVFESRLLDPILNGGKEISYGELVDQFKFDSPTQAHSALGTAKRKFAQCLRRVISEYVPEQSSVEAELRELLVILAHGD